jgi:branched-chain amino acid transport system ATP-binding protein
MAAAPWELVSIAAACFLAMGVIGFLPAYQTMVALVAPPRLRSQAFAWSLFWYALGAVFWTPIVGSIGDAHGERAAVFVLGLLVGVGGAIGATVRAFVRRDIEQAVKAKASADTDALLACRAVDIAYDRVQVLFDVSFDVRQGEILALLGTNGAGKSTLLKGISGLIDPIGGSIFFEGRDITHADAKQTSGLGIVQVPGGRGVFPTLTVGENMRAAGWMYRKDRARLREATERVLEYFPILRDRWDTPAGSLSGGEQQMLSLGQAFIARPKLLLIDELSLGLAPTVVERLLGIVEAIHDNGTTVILVEQSVNLALRLAKRALFMEKGEIRFSGLTSELLDRPDVLRAVFLQGAASANGHGNGSGDKGGAVRGGETKALETTAARRRRAPAKPTKAELEDRARRAAILEGPVVLETHGLTKRYGGIAAVSDVDLTLHQGEILGLIGPNGAGKTTIFDLVCGFTPADGGRVVVNGADVSRRNAADRAAAGVGRSFQDARLWPSLTVREAIAVAFERSVQTPSAVAALFHLPAVTLSEGDVDRRVEEVLRLLGLRAFRDKFVSELSTGSRRMVEIAAILAHRPSVLLLDEPSSGIAQKETEALGPLLRQVQRHLGCSMLVIEHDMPLITGLADHLVALDRGSVVTHGLPQEVLHHPTVVESYLGTRDERDVLPGRSPVGARR